MALGAGVEDAGREGHLGAICPGCWQLKHVTVRSGWEDRRFGGGAEAPGVDGLFLKEEGLEDLLTAAMALAICFLSPVSCWLLKFLSTC